MFNNVKATKVAVNADKTNVILVITTYQKEAKLSYHQLSTLMLMIP